MRSHVIARKTHKWLGLFLGLQVVVWSLSGLYMTSIHIDTIHGDHFVRHQQPRGVDAATLRDPIALASSSGAENVRLAWIDSRPVYVLTGQAGEQVVDARNGEAVARPMEQQVRALARSYYTGPEHISSARLITDIPGEIRGRKPPLWRVEFAHWNKPTLYLSPTTGELVSRRHELWRIFDFFWMLHNMDYAKRTSFNHPLIVTVGIAMAWLAVTGFWLLFRTMWRHDLTWLKFSRGTPSGAGTR